MLFDENYNEYISKILREEINILLENYNDEGFSFGTRGRNSDKTFRFLPGQNDTKTTTRIFDENHKELVRKIRLPKSGIMSYNLYKIESMDISKALKHPENFKGNYDKDSIDKFMKRTALYIKHILGDKQIDMITCPQSSSSFSSDMVKYLLRLYPQSDGIKYIPNMLTKNIRNVYVNTDVAKELGLTNNDIYNLQQRVNKWKSDEDLRDLRRKIKELEDEVLEVKKNRGRGRPTKDYVNKVNLINAYNDKVKELRKGKMGRDSTISKEGNIKDFQIKSIEDKLRRSIEGLFEINPQYKGIQPKIKDKNILIFDDNISSGATLDDVCMVLKRFGAKSIIPITLAVIPKTIYGAHERLE